MDKTFAKRLHKYELLLRGFYLNALRLQIKPYKEFYISNGYLGQPSDLIALDGLKTAYIDSYRIIADAESFRQWLLLENDYQSSKKDFTPEDGFLIVSEMFKMFFLQASITNYNNIRDDLNETTIRAINDFVSRARSNGVTDAEIYSSMSNVFEDKLRDRARLIASTEATTIMGLVKSKVSGTYFDQRGIIGYKTWFTRLDERVRHTHIEVEGRTLPVDTKFVLNKRHGGIEFAEYPGDVRLTAENRINCRCLVEYHSDPDKFKK